MFASWSKHCIQKVRLGITHLLSSPSSHRLSHPCELIVAHFRERTAIDSSYPIIAYSHPLRSSTSATISLRQIMDKQVPMRMTVHECVCDWRSEENQCPAWMKFNKTLHTNTYNGLYSNYLIFNDFTIVVAHAVKRQLIKTNRWEIRGIFESALIYRGCSFDLLFLLLFSAIWITYVWTSTTDSRLVENQSVFWFTGVRENKIYLQSVICLLQNMARV
jgi:hypothetical protein